MLASAARMGGLRWIALGSTLAAGWWAAGLVLVMDNRPAADAQPTAPGPADGDLHVRYAEARLRLAESRLADAEDRNRRKPGLLTEADLRRLRNRVEVLRAQLEATKQKPHGNGLELQRAAAKSMARIAQEEFEAAAAVRRRQPEAVSEQSLRQFELRAEVARLRAQLWDDPSFQRSTIDVMQMQLDQMADMLIDTSDAVDAAPTINRR